MNDICKYYYYIFDASKYKGYRRIQEQAFLRRAEKIKYDGFEFKSSSYIADILQFKIEKQLIRKLKLLNISNGVKFASIEYNIIQLLEKSEEYEDFDYFSTSGMSWYLLPQIRSRDISGQKGDKEEYKGRQKFQSKQYNQKIKQYENKGRFRK